jgi:hypothetical protein
MTPCLHVVGAGLAGLAAAVAASAAGRRVVVHEAAPQAGGRCRSYHDPVLDRTVDTGTHLVLGINRRTLAFARSTGGLAAMAAGRPLFPCLDLSSGRIRTIAPGRLPAGLGETVLALGLPWTGGDETVASRLETAKSYGTLWEPLCLSALNSPGRQASARLFARLLRALLLGGRGAMRPYVFPAGLSAALIDPALAAIGRHGGRIVTGHRLTGLSHRQLSFGDEILDLHPGDTVILAVPPWAARRLLPDLPALGTRAIANFHFLLPRPAPLPGGQPFLALTGAAAQWLSVRGDVLSATLSACPSPPDPAAVWRDVSRVLAIPQTPLPPHRVIFERRATLCHSPGIIARRPAATTRLPGIFLAGDWLASPWPCTIEAAIESGLAAARLAVGQDDLNFP